MLLEGAGELAGSTARSVALAHVAHRVQYLLGEQLSSTACLCCVPVITDEHWDKSTATPIEIEKLTRQLKLSRPGLFGMPTESQN